MVEVTVMNVQALSSYRKVCQIRRSQVQLQEGAIARIETAT